MRVSSTNKLTKRVECIDKQNNIWKVRWDFSEGDNIITFEEKTFNFKPSLSKIKELIYTWYNKQIDKAILSGFVWKDMPIWLSTENQFNYKAAYDLAMQTNGITLPVKFKFGTPDNPIYYTFKDIPDFTDFYVSAMSYINQTLDSGWNQKDAINWDNYIV